MKNYVSGRHTRICTFTLTSLGVLLTRETGANFVRELSEPKSEWILSALPVEEFATMVSLYL